MSVRRPATTDREHTLFTACVALIGLHIADDSFVQPQPGTSAADHLVGGLVPLAVLALAVVIFPRLRAGGRASLALAAGLFGIVVAIEAVHYASTVGASGDDFTGLMAIPAGIALLGLGARILWTSRRLNDAMPRRYARRSLKGLAVAATLILICFPLGLSYVVTHTARSVVPAAEPRDEL